MDPRGIGLMIVAASLLNGCGDDARELMTDAVAVAVGSSHACALREEGGVACWGMGHYGQLGYGSFAVSVTPCLASDLCNGASAVPRHVAGIGGEGLLDDAVAIGAGIIHSCAVRENGGVACWGRGLAGALGNGAADDSHVPVEVQGVDGVGLLDDALSVGVGSAHACALRSNGRVACWGRGSAIGREGGEDSHFPVEVQGVDGEGFLTGVVEIATGSDTTCARREEGTVVCWGSGFAGLLGNGTSEDSLLPTFVSGITDAVGISSRCAIREEGHVVCWGLNLGRGDNSDSNVPVSVFGVEGETFLRDVTSISAGSGTCALRSNRDLYCWGTGTDAEWGEGGRPGYVAFVPVRLPGVDGEGHLEDVVAVSVGSAACAVLADGHLVCWGGGSSGQLGNGGTESSLVPVLVSAPR